MKDQESKTEYVVCCADRYRRNETIILIPIYIAMTTFFVYVFTECEDFWPMIFSATYAITSLIVSAIVVNDSICTYTPKSRIDKNGIVCTFGGRYLKGLTWDEVNDIVCVEFKHFGAGHSPANYLLFSGHELTAEEKDKSIRLTGDKNDIIVVKYSYKLVDWINEVHEFTFKDEITRDGHKKHPLSR